MTEASLFFQVLAAGPLSYADAVAVLMGEDGEVRARAAYEAYRMMAQVGHQPAVVLSGGLDEPPLLVGAQAGAKMLLGLGIAPSRLIVEPMAKNTAEQAREVCELVVLNKWTSLLLVASPYHMPRAFLTFVREMQRREITETLYLMPVFTQTRWWETPPGGTLTRVDLVHVETEKIELYQEKGDVASYADGLAYIRYWEEKRTPPSSIVSP